jgi:hypothetical protein
MPWRVERVQKVESANPSAPYCARLILENTTTRVRETVDYCDPDADWMSPARLQTFLCDNGYDPNDMGVCP